MTNNLSTKDIIENEIMLENNMVTWLRQMVLTFSVTSGILVYFERKKFFRKSIIIKLFLLVLVTTSLLIGLMNTYTYQKRYNILLRDKYISKSNNLNWYLLVSILTTVGFLGVLFIIINEKYRNIG